MINDKILTALNGHLTKEFYSAYLYLSMAAYFDSQSLPGFARWMRVQAQEESSHALIFFNYICDQGGRVSLGAIEAPPADFKSAVDVFEATISHEKEVTGLVHKLMDLALDERDHATKQFLEWFVKEQVEEEATASATLEQLKRVGEGNGLFIMDKDAGARVFAIPQPLVGKI